MGLTRWLVVVALAALGCGSEPRPAPPPPRKVTWDEYQKLAPDQKADPHVADNLDDEAKKKLAAPRGGKRP